MKERQAGMTDRALSVISVGMGSTEMIDELENWFAVVGNLHH
jgi:hypothetical protein